MLSATRRTVVPCACVTLAMLGSTASAHPGHDGAAHESVQPERRAGGEQGGPRTMEKVDLPEPEVSITIEGQYRVVRSNGLPDHEVGEFPNQENPNALRAQNNEIRLPLLPRLSDELTDARPEFGIALNGVIFDSGTGEFWSPDGGRAFGGGSAWNYDALGGGAPFGLDQNNAHVQPTGKYHYHGVPTGLVDELLQSEESEHHHDHDSDHDHMIQIGWAFDGFPIYAPFGYKDANDPTSEIVPLRSSYVLKEGERPGPPDGPGGEYDGTFGLDWEYREGAGDLDESNGRFGVTPEFPQGTYYYVITETFPAVPRYWRGEVERRRQPGGPEMQRQRQGADAPERARPQREGRQGQRRNRDG